MEATFNISNKELTEDFLIKIKKLFVGEHLEITIKEQDETDYLLSTKANNEHLLESLKEAENGHFIEVDLSKYNKK